MPSVHARRSSGRADEPAWGRGGEERLEPRSRCSRPRRHARTDQPSQLGLPTKRFASREQRSRSLGGAGGGGGRSTLSQIVLVTAGRPRVDAQLFYGPRTTGKFTFRRRRQGRRRHDEVHRPADGVRLGWPEDQGGFHAGNAVVLFAYGLSGSGKTFTVFGMDDVNNKSSWFNTRNPTRCGASSSARAARRNLGARRAPAL